MKFIQPLHTYLYMALYHVFLSATKHTLLLNFQFAKLFGLAALFFGTQLVFGQAQTPDVRQLQPDQILERELHGAELHQYQFDLNRGEFFRVRVEQKGVDVVLLLRDEKGNELSRMDSPNGDKGFETMSFVADVAGSFVLEVKSLSEDERKGSYLIRREAIRMATADDRAQVELERKQQASRGQLEQLSAEIVRVFGEINSSTPPETFQAALNKVTQGIEISQEIKSLEYEILFTVYLARLFQDRGDPGKTLEYYEKTLKIINSDKETKANLRSSEITILTGMGDVYEKDMEDSVAAAKLYARALALYQAQQEDANKGMLLRNIGNILKSLKLYSAAEEYYFDAIGVFQRLKLPLEEAVTLGALGTVCFEQKEKLAEGLRYLLDSEKLLEKSPENSDYQNTRLVILTFIYLSYKQLNSTGEASFYRNKAKELQRKTTSSFVRYGSLVLLGEELDEAGEFEEALKIYQEALELEIKSSAPNKSSQQFLLTRITLLYLKLKKGGEAQKPFDQAFDLALQSKNHTELAGLAETFADRLFDGQAFNLAEDYYSLALSVLRSKKNRPKQVNFEQIASVVNKLGKTQIRNGKQFGALTNLRTALTLQMSLYQETNLADMLQDRMKVFAGLNQRRLAIFFGKQVVALKQEIRGTLKTLPIETQRSFLKGNRETYEALVGLLIQENRLGEALQVLNLYQSQEFFDFSSNKNIFNSSLSFTQHEKSALAEQQNLQASLRESKEEFMDNPNFLKLEGVLKKIELDFSHSWGEKDQAPMVPNVTEMQTVLGELETATKQKPAAIYTLITREKFYLLLLTCDGGIKVFKSSVTAGALNSKILKFYALLQSPTYDPRPAGKELHNIIFKPIEAELKRQNIQTLMWQLDGSLRYVPVAALWDGQRYLVERFQNVIFTRVDHERMTRTVSRNWTGSGFGSIQQHTIDVLGDGDTVTLPALPGVMQELEGIFRLVGVGSGILDGEVFADATFTKEAFFEAMKRHRPLVHVSSHFSFRPGDGARSFMLLGDGTALTLDEMKNRAGLFEGVELLTLSACNTAATQPDAHGKEIDGFAELAQRLGAGSVMATLWQVSDDSTPWLMKEFYSIRQSGDGTTKVDALRNAQLALLKGTADTRLFSGVHKGGGASNVRIVVVPDASNQTRNLTRADIVYVSEVEAPLFKDEGQKRFAHPYYWAPFILIGNWQ